jgi:beta-ribofuranosylaminobenzene 5'-phosphate synthase
MRFPEDWSILIVQPEGIGGLHGVDEKEAFAKLPPISRAESESLFRLVVLEVLPAVL